VAPALWWVGPLLGLHFIRLLEFYLECLHCQSFKWIVDSTCLITIIYCVSCHTIHIVEVCALFELFELSLSFALSFALFEFAGFSAVVAPGIALGEGWLGWIATGLPAISSTNDMHFLLWTQLSSAIQSAHIDGFKVVIKGRMKLLSNIWSCWRMDEAHCPCVGWWGHV